MPCLYAAANLALVLGLIVLLARATAADLLAPGVVAVVAAAAAALAAAAPAVAGLCWARETAAGLSLAQKNGTHRSILRSWGCLAQGLYPGHE